MGPRERLNEYLKRVKGKPFAWGSHDCLTFTSIVNCSVTVAYRPWAHWLQPNMRSVG